MSDERAAAIKAALKKIDTSKDEHWTEGGLPAMDHMKASTGLDDLKRDEVSAVAPGLNRYADKPKGGEPTSEEAEAIKTGGKVAVAPMWEEGCMPHDVAAVFTDPVFLIETAMAAMNADTRYSKNSELQSFMRHYLIAQPNIKAHQARLDKRYADAQKAAG